VPDIDHSINFLSFMQSFRRGELLRQGDDALAQVIEGIAATGGNGEVTIKLPFKRNKAGQIECTPSVTSKVPQRPMGTGIYFVNDEQRLSRRDPNQYDIEDVIGAKRASGTD
jgi:hypothetical protein